MTPQNELHRVVLFSLPLSILLLVGEEEEEEEEGKSTHSYL